MNDHTDELCAQFGTIKSIRVMMDDKEECKGFGFVEFEDEVRQFLNDSYSSVLTNSS